MRINFSRTLRLIIIFLILFFWPLNFLLHNQVLDTIHFFLPGILLVVGLTLFKDFTLGRLIVLAGIPLLNTSLLFSPLASIWCGRSRWGLFLVGLIMVITLYFSWQPFLGSSIFYFSQDDQQKIIRQGYLYPSVWLSRTFQNKPSIYLDRFLSNFFAITDPNNYFFGFHPREIGVENQNLQKLPFLSLIFFLIGLYYSVMGKKWLLVSLLLVVVNLSLLKNFDKSDAILWLPIVLITIEGLKKFDRLPAKISLPFIAVFLILTLTEYLHLLINFLTNK